MDLSLAKAASAAGSALALYASKAFDGTPRQQALQEIHDSAARRAVREISEAGELTEMDLIHAVALLERLITSADSGEITLQATPPGHDEKAVPHDLDQQASPLPFDLLVHRLLQVIAQETTEAVAAEPGGTLFPSVALCHLENLRDNATAMARVTPLSGEVAKALSRAKQRCRAADRILLTPDVLLALLEMPDGAVTMCFEAAAEALARRVGDTMRRYLATSSVAPFRPFDWLERCEVRQAQTHTWIHGVACVNAPALLLGILDTPSNTRNQLAAWLGPQFDRVRHHAVHGVDDLEPVADLVIIAQREAS